MAQGLSTAGARSDYPSSSSSHLEMIQETDLVSLKPSKGKLDLIRLDDWIPREELYSDQIVDDIRLSVFHEMMIRLGDIIGAILGLIVFLPLFICIALAIRLTSRGPAIYKQKRVGKRGRVFVLYKFRTMLNDSEEIWGFKPATENDERITVIGRFLRKTRLDELPQLMNVLKGDMSLVGPRPENLYRVSVHKALRGVRLAVRPGITGLAQIRALYDVKPEHKIKYDYIYIQNRSVLLNWYIIFRTIPVLIRKTGW